MADEPLDQQEVINGLMKPPVNPAHPPEAVANLIRSLAGGAVKRGLDWVKTPGLAMQGTPPTTPGMWSDEDEAKQQINQNHLNNWAFGTAANEVFWPRPGGAGQVTSGATFPKGYHEAVPMEQRLSGKGISHPGYRWEIVDRQSGKTVGEPYTNKIRARGRMDKLDNDYGAYRYNHQAVQAQTLTKEEEAFLKEKGLFEPGGWGQVPKD